MGSDPDFQLEVNGQMYISCTPGTSSGYYFASYNTDPLLMPQWNFQGYIGKYNYKMYRTYSMYVYYDHLIDYSDISIKENIRSIESPLSSICQIKGIQYDLKREYFVNSREDKMDELVESGKNKYGVVAQELKEILPDLVVYDDDAKLYGVKYVELIPILVEAIKEQQTQIEALQTAVSGSLKGATVATANLDSQLPDLSSSTLHQNAPNPFTDETTISYSLSETVGAATLFIYDMSGKQLRSYNLHERKGGEILIEGRELDAGMYLYTLIADGQLIGTKQMVLTGL